MLDRAISLRTQRFLLLIPFADIPILFFASQINYLRVRANPLKPFPPMVGLLRAVYFPLFLIAAFAVLAIPGALVSAAGARIAGTGALVYNIFILYLVGLAGAYSFIFWQKFHLGLKT